MYARIIVLFAVIAVVAIVLAFVGIALSGGGDDGGEVTSPDVDGPLASCSALDELESYRYAVSVHITNASTPLAETPEGEETPAPLDVLGDALAQLLSDFSLDGAYVKPDRSQALLTFGEDAIELRQIGDQSWVRVGDEWDAQEASADELLTPVLICNEVIQAVSGSLTLADPPNESVNGDDSSHYVLDPTKTQNLPPLLGQNLEGAYTLDLWVAKDDRHPAKLAIESDDPNSEEAAFSLTMDVVDVNDSGISVEPPPE